MRLRFSVFCRRLFILLAVGHRDGQQQNSWQAAVLDRECFRDLGILGSVFNKVAFRGIFLFLSS